MLAGGPGDSFAKQVRSSAPEKRSRFGMKSMGDTPAVRKVPAKQKRHTRRYLRVFGLNALRGVAYATGMSLVTVASWWIQHR